MRKGAPLAGQPVGSAPCCGCAASIAPAQPVEDGRVAELLIRQEVRHVQLRRYAAVVVDVHHVHAMGEVVAMTFPRHLEVGLGE